MPRISYASYRRLSRKPLPAYAKLRAGPPAPGTIELGVVRTADGFRSGVIRH